MTDIAFFYDKSFFYSPILNGGIKVQVGFATKCPVRVVLETRLSSSNPWVVHRNFTASGSLIVSIVRFAEGQQFRLRSSRRPSSAQSSVLDAGSFPSDADFNELSKRVTDLEEGNEPLVLSINPETGNLEQEGISSGTFGIDEEAGTLYFES